MRNRWIPKPLGFGDEDRLQVPGSPLARIPPELTETILPPPALGEPRGTTDGTK